MNIISNHTMPDTSRTTPFRAYKRQQEKIGRRRLYPTTAFYSSYSIIVLVLALRSAHPYVGLAFYLAGIPVWTFNEYLFHRYVLHGRFKQSKKFYKKFYTRLANKYLDPLHWEHHERPYDGLHISGQLKDVILLFVVAVPVSFIFPVYTAPVLLGGVVQSFVAEQLLHHAMHFYHFRNRYFRYRKRYHLYHHTSQRIEKGFGITSGFWDIVFKTRFSDSARQRLSGRGRYARFGTQDNQSIELSIETRGRE